MSVDQRVTRIIGLIKVDILANLKFREYEHIMPCAFRDKQ